MDIFHAKTKHTETDVICQKYCNAAQFRELIGPDNNWIFNSSVAEQVNNWFGKFHSIVREMSVIRYYFHNLCLSFLSPVHSDITFSLMK